MKMTFIAAAILSASAAVVALVPCMTCDAGAETIATAAGAPEAALVSNQGPGCCPAHAKDASAVVFAQNASDCGPKGSCDKPGCSDESKAVEAQAAGVQFANVADGEVDMFIAMQASDACASKAGCESKAGCDKAAATQTGAQFAGNTGEAIDMFVAMQTSASCASKASCGDKSDCEAKATTAATQVASTTPCSSCPASKATEATLTASNVQLSK